jgi:hypothetical protein
MDYVLDPYYVRNLNLWALWNFCEGTGLLRLVIRVWGTKGFGTERAGTQLRLYSKTIHPLQLTIPAQQSVNTGQKRKCQEAEMLISMPAEKQQRGTSDKKDRQQ